MNISKLTIQRIPIEKLKKITNYEVQEMFKETTHHEQEKTTNDIEIIREDYKRIINKFNTLANRYTRIKNIVDETINKAEKVQEENFELRQENQRLKIENSRLKDYIDKTFEYVKDNIKIEVEDGYLTVHATIDSNKEEKDEGKFVRKERYMGSCSRSFYVGDDVKEEDIKATFRNGILKLEVPKVEEKKELPEKKYIQIED